jgi:PAS domain S-box-containing protein
MEVMETKTLVNALRDSEARLSAILNAEPECVKLFSADCILEYINPAGLAIFQAQSQEQVCGKNLLDGLEPRYVDQFKELTRRVFHGGTGTMEYEITGLKGRRLRLETHAVPLRDAKGNVQHLLAVTRDITEKKAAEDALRSSAHKFRALIENSHDVIALIGREGDILYCSPATTKILGYAPEELLGRRLTKAFHRDDLRSVKRELEAVTSTPSKVAGLNVRVRHKDGSWRLIEGTLTNLLDNPDVRAIVANYRDVTERVRARQALERAEERFEIAFRSSPLPMTISTLSEGRFLDVNKAFLAMTGFAREDILGRTGAELALWERPEHRRALAEILAEPNQVFSVLTTLRTRSGAVRQLELSAARIELADIPCALIVSRDVTEAKNLEQRFRQAQKMEAIGRLAGGVAHDFNNILGVIIGYSDISKEKLDPGHPVARHLAQIERAAERGASLTRRLLAFSRQQVAFPRSLDLNSVINNVNEMLARVIGEDITLVFRPGDRLPSIKCDLGQMEQILMNLAVNARDAMPGGGRITIETRVVKFDEPYRGEEATAPPGKYVMLSMSDTGCGMDEATKAHLFEPFFTTKEAGKGTGLGLSTVYGIVRQNGGYIRVYSELGKGTTFKIYFPWVPEKAEPIEIRRAERNAPGGSETVLLVEDEQPLRSLAKEMLGSAGYVVVEADSPEQAIEMIRNQQPIDLLLTDVIMPKMSGAELSRKAKAIRPELKVLFMSGHAGDILDQQVALVPESALIEKPFTRSALLSTVHEVLHRLALPNARYQI